MRAGIRNTVNRCWTALVIVVLLVVTACVSPVENARILAIESFAGKSHWNFMSAVLRALTDVGGHDVTVFTPFPEGDRDNYTELDTSGILPIKVGIDLMVLKRMIGDAYALVAKTMAITKVNCAVIYSDRRLTDLMAKGLGGHFDAIVIEPSLPVCVTYVAAGTGLPVIYTAPMPTSWLADRRTFGDVPNPAAVSSILARHAVPRTFAQRFYNTWLSLYAEAYVALYDYDTESVAGDRPNPYDAYDVPVWPSMVFTNGHYISDASRPIPANVVNVGGIHLRPPEKIPEDILEFIEDSPHGVILFTFGSSVLISSMPDDLIAEILKALALLPQRTLLKYERVMEDKPNNIMIKKWFPQRDILLHPNVKLFISHGGISGVYEAVDAGIPVLGFPVFSDQFRNIDNMVEAGMAISMEILTVSSDELLKNILELVNNEKYTKNAKIASDLFKDRPMSPQMSVVYWTEYVIRHKGAPHLKSQALNLTWYQYFLLDVIAVMFILIAIVSIVIYRILKIIVHQSKFMFKYYHIVKKPKPE